jgi:hypothetical protein
MTSATTDRALDQLAADLALAERVWTRGTHHESLEERAERVELVQSFVRMVLDDAEARGIV